MRVDLALDQIILDLRVGLRLFRVQLEGSGDCKQDFCGRSFTGDVFGGARYWKTDLAVEVKGQGGIIDLRLDGTDERVDPFIGGRLTYGITPRWVLRATGDIGGFGIGDAVDFSWQVQGQVGFHMTCYFTLALGWRVLETQESEGTGAEREDLDILQHGPEFGFWFNF